MTRHAGALALALLAGGALAQAPCPSSADVTPHQLLGVWQADFQGSWDGATLRLEPHPDYHESFRGTLERDGRRAQVAGDLEAVSYTHLTLPTIYSV